MEWDSQGLRWLLESEKLWGRREAVEGERDRNIGKWKLWGIAEAVDGEREIKRKMEGVRGNN